MLEPTTLHLAWQRVRANRGGPGGDAVTLAQFERRLDEEIATLRRSIVTGRYRPGPLRRIAVPKSDGGERILAIPCVRDRVVQTALLLVLQPLVEQRQSHASFGYRPARGVAEALDAVRRAHAAGLSWTLEADIVQYFASVPHHRLLGELAIWIEAEDVLCLLAQWLAGFSDGGVGIAQGAPISPLLANLYLHPMDRLLVAAGYVPVRYADDFVVLARGAHAVEQAWRMTEGILAERGLGLKDRKTRIVAPGVAFTFLGQTLCAPVLSHIPRLI